MEILRYFIKKRKHHKWYMMLPLKIYPMSSLFAFLSVYQSTNVLVMMRYFLDLF